MHIEINGSFTRGKEMMKKLRAENVSKRNDTEKEINKHKGPGLERLQKELSEARKAIKVYSVSKVMPVKYQGNIVNGKLLQSFVKKLKGFHLAIDVKPDRFELLYGHHPGRFTGKLVLKDLSQYFKGFTDVPELKVIQ